MKLHHFLAGALPAALMFGTQPTHSGKISSAESRVTFVARYRANS